MTPAFEYGVLLGTLQQGVQKMMSDIAKGMESVRLAHLNAGGLNTLLREDQSVLRYQRAVAHERRLAKAYFDRLIIKEEARLGLKPEFDPRRRK